MPEMELELSTVDPVLRRLTDISVQELIDAGVPPGCFGCSTAQLRANTGYFERECPGPTDTIKTMGKVITGQFCKYPTGPDVDTLTGEAIKPKVVISYLGDKAVMVGEDGPVHISGGPTIEGYRDWTPERLAALLYVIDHQGESLTHRDINRGTNPKQKSSANRSSSVRSWLMGLETAGGTRIIDVFKTEGIFYVRSSDHFDLVADQSLRDLVEGLSAAGK